MDEAERTLKTEKVCAALRNQIAESERALTVFEHPEWPLVQAYVETLRAMQERLLHDSSVSSEARDRACVASAAFAQVLQAKTNFEKRRDVAKTRLQQLEQRQPADVWDRILTFIR